VIGKVGFGVDFGATRSISQGDEPGAVFQLMEQGGDAGGVNDHLQVTVDHEARQRDELVTW
jgi:hypothetical protein